MNVILNLYITEYFATVEWIESESRALFFMYQNIFSNS